MTRCLSYPETLLSLYNPLVMEMEQKNVLPCKLCPLRSPRVLHYQNDSPPLSLQVPTTLPTLSVLFHHHVSLDVSLNSCMSKKLRGTPEIGLNSKCTGRILTRLVPSFVYGHLTLYLPFRSPVYITFYLKTRRSYLS